MNWMVSGIILCIIKNTTARRVKMKIESYKLLDDTVIKLIINHSDIVHANLTPVEEARLKVLRANGALSNKIEELLIYIRKIEKGEALMVDAKH